MINLNPNQLQDKSVTQNLFPPKKGFFKEFFSDDYQAFLKTNATTQEGMNTVAKHYGVEEDWNSYLNLLAATTKQMNTTSYYTLSRLQAKMTICGSVLLKVYIDMLQ
jgi:hypothetical protein